VADGAHWDDLAWQSSVLRGGAVFHLYKCYAEDRPDPDTGFTPHAALIGPDGCYWARVDDGVSTTDLDQPITFMLAPDSRYRLVEAQSPVGYVRPPGHWYIDVIRRGLYEFDFEITASDPATPALIPREEVRHNDLDIGRRFFVGNQRWQMVLPATGGRGVAPVVMGGLVVLAGAGAFGAVHLRRERNRLAFATAGGRGR
jgi:hypothetical protein